MTLDLRRHLLRYLGLSLHLVSLRLNSELLNLWPNAFAMGMQLGKRMT